MLAHRLIQIGQANLNANVVWLCEKQFFQEANRLRLAIAFEMDFRELEEERPRFAHHTLLDVKICEALKRANLFGRKFRDALINSDCFCEKTVANEDLREAFEIIDCLESFALANIEFADSHQGDLILGFILEDLLVFGDGLRDFALIEELLRGFDVFALVIAHANDSKLSRKDSFRGFLLSLGAVKQIAKRRRPHSGHPARGQQGPTHFIYATGGE